MFSIGRVAFVAALLSASGLLANCASQQEIKARISGRWGPNPAIQANDVDDALTTQMKVLGALAYEARIGEPSPDGKEYLPGTADEWMRVAQAGFNVGREDCEVYMDNLFRMARERQRNDSMINAASTASNAILQATKAQKAVSIVGASLGMLMGLNDAIFDSYLFAQAPALISGKVRDVQATYRDSIEKSRGLVTSPETAFNAIQTYYSYCLPHSIEGMLLQKIADSTPAVTSPTTPTKQPAAPKKVGAATTINQVVKLK